jgi:organic radical activating enzyme
MNILFTTFCNKSCSYCFAKGKLNSHIPKSYISLRNLKIIINFLKRSQQYSVGVIGGEPTLHPDFKKAIATLLKEGFFVHIFTNGIIKKEYVDFLSTVDRDKFSILINVNSLESYSKNELSLIKNTLKTLRSNVGLGFTIYKINFKPDFLLSLIMKYKLKKHIRFGMASPIWGYDNEYLSLMAHKKVARKITQFAKKCDIIDVSIGFDCGFTLCSFTENDCGRLFYYNARLSADCGHVIDVGPDLKVWRCFATSMIWNRMLTDFKDLDSIYKFYENKCMAFRRIGSFDKCLRCRYLERRQCAGGCLGHTLKSFDFDYRLNSHLFK